MTGEEKGKSLMKILPADCVKSHRNNHTARNLFENAPRLVCMSHENRENMAYTVALALPMLRHRQLQTVCGTVWVGQKTWWVPVRLLHAGVGASKGVLGFNYRHDLVTYTT